MTVLPGKHRSVSCSSGSHASAVLQANLWGLVEWRFCHSTFSVKALKENAIIILLLLLLLLLVFFIKMSKGVLRSKD